MARATAKATAKGKKPSGRSAGEKPTAITIKGNPEWRDWVDQGAKYCRTDVAKLMDAAVVEYLKARGFPKEAPAR